MNGATAEPCVRIKRPPSSAIIRMMGTSTNLRRARMNYQSSAKMDSMSVPLELIFHRAGQGSRRRAFDPVAFRGRIEGERQGALAESAHDEPDRRDHQKEQNPHDHGIHDFGDEQRELR